MRNKMKRILSLLLILVMLTGCSMSGPSASRSQAAEADAFAEADAIAEAASSLLRSHGSKEGKEETVYVIADANGQPTRTIVSAWLKNPEEAETITDRADLTNIQNVKGDESYTIDGDGNLVWDAKGNDIYYQGDSQLPLPLTAKVAYTLDGKTVTAEELAGASGRLAMTFTYDNHTGTEREVGGKTVTIYQPFMAVSCAVLNSDKASSVEVTNGKIINLGEQIIVAGVAMPGLKESLGLDSLEGRNGAPVDVDIPETVIIEADVTDFSLLTTLTIVETGLLDDFNLENVDSFDELQDSMSELTDASSQLVNGTNKLYNGTVALSGGADSLAIGVVELDDGAKTIASNMEELYSGLLSLQDGASTLAGGLDSLEEQVQGLPAGVAALSSGAGALKTALEEQIKGGASSLQSGAETVSETLRNDIGGGATAIQAGAESIADNAATLADAARQVESGLSGLSGLSEQAGAAVEGLNTAKDYSANAQAQLSALLEAGDLSEEQATALSTALTLLQGSDQYISGIVSGLSGLSGQDGSSAVEALEQIAAGADAIAAGAKSGNADNPGLYEAAAALAAGAETLAEQGSDVLAAGAGQLAAGVDTIISGNDGDNLNALIGGLDTMNSSSQALVSGISQLSSGADTLSQGTETAASGAKQLSDGANTLAEGTKELKKGTKDLTSGIVNLMDGASSLMNGMSKFNSDGIQSLSELFQDDTQSFFDRLRAIKAYGDEYTSYSGKAEDMPGTVRFIIRTDSIGD